MIVWYAQEHPASCVAACVRIALSNFGIYLPEAEIRRMLGNPRFGLTLPSAARKLCEAGAVAEWHGDWSLDDLRDCLRAGHYPIVGVERRFFGHASAHHAIVLTGLDSSEVAALDPLSGPANQTYHLTTFEDAWQSAGKEALVLLSPLP
jgi:ABC-type bacteriocin/lantibiotic exporter with double-glycine peptidase domain